MDIYNIIDALVTNFKCKCLSKIGASPADIDMYSSNAEIEDTVDFLKSEGFTITGVESGQYVFRRFEGKGKLYIIDLMTDFSVYTNYISSFQISKKCTEKIGGSPSLFRAFKYLCLGSKDKFEYGEKHFDEIQGLFIDRDNFEWIDSGLYNYNFNSYKNLVNEVHKVKVNGKFFSGIYKKFLYPLSLRLKALGNGSSIAFVGPDGSGKTFIIDKLKPIGVTKEIYMGDWFFKFQFLYNQIIKIPSPFNRFVYLFYPFENYFRMIKVIILELFGRIVLIDRFPGTNRNVIQAGGLKKINDLTFKMFRKPKLIVFLYAPPKVIYKRKQELRIDEIELIQNNLSCILKEVNHITVDTQNLDNALNSIMREIF